MPSPGEASGANSGRFVGKNPSAKTWRVYSPVLKL